MIVRGLKDRAKKFDVADELERAEPGLITRTEIAHLA